MHVEIQKYIEDKCQEILLKHFNINLKLDFSRCIQLDKLDIENIEKYRQYGYISPEIYNLAYLNIPDNINLPYSKEEIVYKLDYLVKTNERLYNEYTQQSIGHTCNTCRDKRECLNAVLGDVCEEYKAGLDGKIPPHWPKHMRYD